MDDRLTDEEVLKRQSVYGLNALAEEPPTPLWKLILEQFEDYLVQILLVSAVLSFVLAFFENGGESSVTAFVEPFVILLMLILNAIVGVWQENNAESALNALKKMQSEKARCIRNGVVNPNLSAGFSFLETLFANSFSISCVVSLNVGDKVPADC